MLKDTNAAVRTYVGARRLGLPRGIAQLHTYGLPSNNAASRAEKALPRGDSPCQPAYIVYCLKLLQAFLLTEAFLQNSE